MTKYTRSSIESLVTSKRAGFHGRAQTAKEAYLPARKAILDNPRLSEQAARQTSTRHPAEYLPVQGNN